MVMQDIKSTTEKNGRALRAILMAMHIRQYGAEQIKQYGRSRATLYATENHHGASIHPLPQRTPWSSILVSTIELWRCGNRFPELAFKRHKTDPVLSSLKQKAA